MGNNHREKIVMSIGGSLIVPNGGINIEFLKKLNTFVREQLAKDNNRQFFLVAGGGSISRHYRDAGREVVGHELTKEDMDWLGIHTTKLNAHLIRTIFRDIAHPYVLKHYEIIRKVTEPVVVAAGWKPGWSTDFCAAMVCEDYNIKTLINLTNIDMVYDSDPNQNKNAKPIKKTNWEDFRKIVGDKWVPGMNAPFDPVASKKAQELGIKVVVLRGDDFDNLNKYFNGEKFVGTVIE
ncbi:MAG: UMP kinase [Candidatus Levybacteria bacterium]|nr:UMP kinase [Candidatus Levybacteria bacterium]